LNLAADSGDGATEIEVVRIKKEDWDDLETLGSTLGGEKRLTAAVPSSAHKRRRWAEELVSAPVLSRSVIKPGRLDGDCAIALS